MKVKFIHESMDQILKPKSKEDIMGDISNLSQEEKDKMLLRVSTKGNSDLVELLLKARAMMDGPRLL